MLRRLVLTTVATAAALGAAVPTAGAAVLPLPLLNGTDKLTITVAATGNPEADGTYELECGPRTAAGTHPVAQDACARLEELSAGGRDPFAPVSKERMCTQQHGGHATARITGTWHGRDVNARFTRTNGCEIARWDNLRPVLPMARS